MAEYYKNLVLISLKKRRNFTLICFLLCFLFSSTGQSQIETVETSSREVVVEDSAFKDNLGRDTPRSSFLGFLNSTEEFDYETAAQYIDLRNLPHAVRQYDGNELARQLDFVIRRGMKIDANQLSQKTTGQVVDGLPDYRDELGHLVGDGEEQVLYMQRLPGLDDNFIWKVSNVSIALVPDLYDYFSYPEWVEKIREHLPSDASFLGVEMFKWLIILSATAILLPIFWLIGVVLSKLISKPAAPLHKSVRKLLTRPIPVFITMLITGALLRELGLGAKAQAIVDSKTLLTVVFVWIVFSLVDLLREKRRNTFLAQGRADAHILGRPLANAVKLFTVLAAALVWLSNSGVEISALLAGLGVGGVALALALQKPIEDLLGAVSLYSQQPMQTGDFCKYGTTMGNIEEIGLRTTRIRTLSDTLVSVPNSIIAHGEIENISARQKILYHPALPLRYDTTREQMQAIIDGIDAMARSHERVIGDSVRVRFTEYSENAMIIKARIFVDETDFSNYLEVVGDLNMAIMRVVQENGAHFAQGAKTIMLENIGRSTLQGANP